MQHDRGDVGDAEHLVGELLDDQDRDVVGGDALHDVVELLDDERREPHRQLVEQQHLRVGAERARDREHLLLATRQRAAICLRRSFRRGKRAYARSSTVDNDMPAVGHHAEVLGHGEVREDAAALGDDAQAVARQAVGGATVDAGRRGSAPRRRSG